ncbi:arylsulfatase A-like enzyme [Dyadobacter jejuensis]|uniref:Arylsulfatase A-like enzyme n=1 Tax=Dyadobacter jejuensis TaxID=1082580 RepID=A0A316ARW1_9BACT|nr:sulfatase [Dyadobacter jejuensis]PWJ60433.1 arylsulfatase A-like enzyme [Dyadobacter jejuensis]
MKKYLLPGFGVLLLICSFAVPEKKEKKPNVLFIFVDDLRPDLACYGNKEIYSPNIDQLAKEGALFTNQYVTVPTCGASRYSLLTGQLPRRTEHLSNSAFEKLMKPGVKTSTAETFVDQFRRNGYRTVGLGKISHSADGYVYGYTEPKSDRLEMPQSWDEMLFDSGHWKTGWNAFFAYADGASRMTKDKQVKPYEKGKVGDQGYPDGLTAQLAVDKLQELAKSDQPFFLGVGFFKPHLPFNAPQKYWDLYDEDSISLTPSPNLPAHVHPASLHESGEFNQYALGEEKASLDKPVSDAYARKVKHGYYACVSYTDALVGKVLGQLKTLGLDDNTVVVLWGDHGWHLGDDRVWGKHTIFERSLRSALIIKAPEGLSGIQRDEIVSAIDIYPTLMELCKLEKPQHLDGKSMNLLLKQKAAPQWDNRAFSYFKNGITLRDKDYRYTKYFRNQMPNIELYDHRSDPFENTNIAASNPKVIAQMEKKWRVGDTGIFKNKENK